MEIFRVPGGSPAAESEIATPEDIIGPGFSLVEHMLHWAAAIAQRILNGEMDKRVGKRYVRSDQRCGYRNGTARGFVIVGGRKMQVNRPRAVDARGQEIQLKTYRQMQDPTLLDQAALAKVCRGVAQRGAAAAFAEDQPLPPDSVTYGASRSSISRNWTRACEEQLAAEFQRPLNDRKYPAILLDGKGFGDHLLIAAMGIDLEGDKHILGIVDGSSENADVCAALLDNLVERGLDVSDGVLVVMDGGKGLAAAVRSRWGDVAQQSRCRAHKGRNIREKVPEKHRPEVMGRLHDAWNTPDPDRAERLLLDLVDDLDAKGLHDAKASLEEGLQETLTLQRLGLQPVLGAVLGTTNLMENAFSTTEYLCHRVTNWQNPAQALRWAMMSLHTAARGFTRAAPPAVMAQLAAALRKRVHGSVAA